MALRLHNTLTKSLETFSPLEPPKVRMYNCGPTVYNYAHIGNYRSFMLADLLRRVLEERGYEVTQVMNITDVGHLTRDDADAGEDKIEKAAREKKLDPYEIVEFYSKAFFEDFDALRMRRAHVYPRATRHVPEMLESCRKLIERGHAYVVDGEVYYDVTSFPAYGRLSGNTLENLRAGARVEVDPRKRGPFDFALWKKDPKHLMQWESPFGGKGFPGWHIECSTMSKKYLGDTLDIHTGGEDNIFPHHEDEIAQAEGETGKTFVRTWVHAHHLLVDGKKMSKSEGNFYTLRDLLEKGFSGRGVRLALLSSHYRQNMNLTLDALSAAEEGVRRFETFLEDLALARGEGLRPEFRAAADRAVAAFDAALDDDLNTSQALAAAHGFLTDANRMKPSRDEADLARETVGKFDRILGVLPDASDAKGDLDSEIQALVDEREAARKSKDFRRSDEIRDELKHRGIELEDTKQGVRWRRLARPAP